MRAALAALTPLHAAALAAALSVAPPADGPEIPPTIAVRAGTLSEAAVRYAPLVYLHPDESYLPDDPLHFIEGSRLRWAHDELCFDHAVADPVVPRLLNGGYAHATSRRLGFRCTETQFTFDSSASVRPRTRESGGEGFFLELRGDEGRSGLGTAAPVLVQQSGDRLLTYWFFYAYNEGSGFDHEGDWENVTIRLNEAGAPVEIAFFAHGHASVREWSEIQTEGGRPIVFSALGSHASYPDAGFHLGLHRPDWTGTGQRWDTAANLRNAADEPWWGYGGAWGEVGEFASTTGPKGPGRFKSGIPSAWLTREERLQVAGSR